MDAAYLSLTDIDLSQCRFVGTVHLDQLRIKGYCNLADSPSGWRWARRRTLIEEHHWRHHRGTLAWTDAPDGQPVQAPAALTALYRELRKALEDGKDEPGAADFYYGEMEMRRHDSSTPHSEQWLLAMYWLLSGYGLRAARALGWLLAAMTVTVLLLMVWGIPQVGAHQELRQERVHGRTVTVIDTLGPVDPHGDRFTGERFNKALNVTINSVVFRSSGQDLTTAGGYLEMASRFTEPILLGLAALAIRGRVKR
ncbi:hypothetical protein [Streptomyces sp. NPDC046805]|uniref:hypothetical protein n=1 Tax=Streptomyces sp. NPDC046805 TaxID=3155134 RepID=UPI0033D81621